MQRIYLIALTVLMLSLPIPVLAQSATPAAAASDERRFRRSGRHRRPLALPGVPRHGQSHRRAGGGYRASGRYWTDDLLQPDAPRTMVLPGVAESTRVCAYDRPGTYASIGEDDFLSRSDPIAQPRTAPEVVAELHALLQAAEVPGPYVLAGHSLGGFFARLYASHLPRRGRRPRPRRRLLRAAGERDAARALAGAGAAQPGVGRGHGHPDSGLRRCRDDRLRRGQRGDARGGGGLAAAADAPGRPRPRQAVRPAGGRRAGVHAPRSWKRSCRRQNEDQAALVPDARFSVASESGHDIHQDQPELVIEAIRQVVAGVRNPDTWYDLTSCCAT